MVKTATGESVFYLKSQVRPSLFRFDVMSIAGVFPAPRPDAMRSVPAVHSQFPRPVSGPQPFPPATDGFEAGTDHQLNL